MLVTTVGGAARAERILVLDPSGGVFAALRSAGVAVALWRVTKRTSFLHLEGVRLAVVAVYDRPNWTAVTRLAERIPTVLIAMKPSDLDACKALGFGAYGYLDARLPKDAFRRAIHGALNGEPAYSRRVLADWIRLRAVASHAGTTPPLTPRQREVVALIGQGAADKQIAWRLGIGTATAQKHVSNLLRRLNVPNRAAAVAAVASTSPPR